MGKKIIIPGTDFSANAIAIPMLIKITAGQSVTIDGVTYTGGTNGEAYELDTFPTTFHENSAKTYLESVSVNSENFILNTGYFQYQQGLKKVSFLSPFKSTNNLNTVFAYCAALTQIVGLDGLDTSGVTNFSQMFRSCGQLASVDVSSFDTSSATNLSNMFAGSMVSSLDLSSFDTSKVTDMSRVFSGCTHLASLVLGENWDMVTKSPTVTDLFYSNNALTAITAPNCKASEYGTAGKQITALIAAIAGSGFTAARAYNSLVITCSDGTVTGTYVHGTGWSWSAVVNP